MKLFPNFSRHHLITHTNIPYNCCEPSQQQGLVFHPNTIPVFTYFFCHLYYSVTTRSCRHVPGFMGTKGISGISSLRPEICISFQIIKMRAVCNNYFIIHSKSFFEGIFYLHINFVYSCQLANLYYDHWKSEKTKNDFH